jgi:RecB family exonuclease
MAHRDLDAVVALFEAAARAEDQQEHTSAEAFLHTLRAQQIPADTLAEQGVRDDAVRLLTAHRAKGLEWLLVVVAHAQEGAWPDLRRRATLLRADRIGVGGRLVPPTTARELLADERRLFYVACTRARRRLVVTAVASTDDEGEQPSRFLSELYPDDDGHRIRHVEGRPRRPLSLAGLVAELRRTAADEREPEELREAAAVRLARLTREHRSGTVRVPGADPATWWGTATWSEGAEPLRPLAEPVVISASALTSLTTCPAQWFLNREAGAERATTQAQGFGNVVHALADRIGRGDEPLTGRTRGEVVDALMAHVDEVWGQIPFRTPWSSGREREQVRQALDRFLVKHESAARTLVATEVPLRADVDLPDGQRVRLHGYADRLELDAQGRVVVIDLKTGKGTPTQAQIAEHPQLGLYQLAVEHGALPGHTEAGGAELWQLRQEVGGGMRVQAQDVQDVDTDGLRIIDRQLMEAARRLRIEEFPARPGTHCDHCAFERFCPARTAGTVLS